MAFEKEFREYIKFILKHHNDEGFYDNDGESPKERQTRQTKQWRENNKEHINNYSKKKRKEKN